MLSSLVTSPTQTEIRDKTTVIMRWRPLHPIRLFIEREQLFSYHDLYLRYHLHQEVPGASPIGITVLGTPQVTLISVAKLFITSQQGWQNKLSLPETALPGAKPIHLFRSASDPNQVLERELASGHQNNATIPLLCPPFISPGPSAWGSCGREEASPCPILCRAGRTRKTNQNLSNRAVPPPLHGKNIYH